MLRIPRLRGVVIKRMDELVAGDVVVLPPSWYSDQADTMRVETVEFVGDDVVVNDSMTSSFGNLVIVVDENN